MNSIMSFIKARTTKIEPKVMACNKFGPIVEAFKDNNVSVVHPQEYDWNGTLMVERAFGKNEEISGFKMELLRSYVGWEAAKKTHNLTEYSNRFTSVKDGGSFWDSLLFRGAGDTPIAICEHVTPIALQYDCLEKYTPHYIDWGRGQTERMLGMCGDYVYKYRPAALNNHLTFKALYLLIVGHVLDRFDWIHWAYGAYQVCLEQIDNDGYMPLELERGDKAASYSRMNLEALNFITEVLVKLYGKEIPEKVKLANHNFYVCLTDHNTWKRLRKVGEQRLPEEMNRWAWVLTCSCDADVNAYRNTYYKPFDRNQNSYIYNFIP